MLAARRCREAKSTNALPAAAGRAPRAVLVVVGGVVVVGAGAARVPGVLCGRGAALVPAPPAASRALSAYLSY